MNLANIVEVNAWWNRNSTAVISAEDGLRYSYGEFNSLVNKFGNALKEMGVKKGERVAIYLPNSVEFFNLSFCNSKNRCRGSSL